MRDNSSRLAAPTPQEPSPIKEFRLDFTAVRDVVALPSRGLYYPVGHPFRGKEEVEIKFMTAKEEDILVNQKYLRNGSAIDKLLSSLLVDKFDVDTLLIQDKAALVVAARITGYGAEYKVQSKCGSCGSKTLATFDLHEFQPKPLPNIDDLEGVELVQEGVYSVKLETLGHLTVHIRPLNGADEKYLTRADQLNKKNKRPASMITDQLRRLIVAVGDKNSFTNDEGQINQLVNALPATDSRLIRKAHETIFPSLDNNQSFECSHCGDTTEVEVPIATAQFFWPKS